MRGRATAVSKFRHRVGERGGGALPDHGVRVRVRARARVRVRARA